VPPDWPASCAALTTNASSTWRCTPPPCAWTRTPTRPPYWSRAYVDADAPLEEQLHTYGDLRDLARYLDRQDIVATADARQRSVARDWVADADDGERRYRLRTVQSAISREAADDIRDELDAGN
jgi:hypothetical protein